MKPKLPTIAALALAPAVLSAADLEVTVKNPLGTARESATIELHAIQLAPLDAPDLRHIHVTDASGKNVLCQAVDTDGDAFRRPDIVIFQTDLAASETKTFTVSSAAKQVYRRDDFKAYGRFNRERFDDFAWENDRVAFRTYGRALETWEGEPLTSSTIDLWCKRTPRIVVNDWYMADDYHADHGEGADFYSAGLSRGCGSGGIWAKDRLWTSRNFVNSNVLANGPIRLIFELTYAPFEVDGISVGETKRVTLDAGSQLNHIVSTYKQFTKPGEQRELTAAVGLKKAPGEKTGGSKEAGMFWKWEPVSPNDPALGNQGLALLSAPGGTAGLAEDALNHLLLVTVPADGRIESWSGFAWDKAGHIADPAAWESHLASFAAALASPVEVTVNTK